MPCILPGCGLVTSLVDTFWTALANQVQTAAAQIVTQSFTWWTTAPSVPIDQPAILYMNHFVLFTVAAPLAIIGLLIGLAQFMWTGTGLFHRTLTGLFMFAVVTIAGIPVIAVLMSIADELSKMFINAIPFHDLGSKIAETLRVTGLSPLYLIPLSGLLFILGLMQYVMMLGRTVAIILICVALPIGAAMHFVRGSSSMVSKLGTWLLALIFFKPAAAFVYFVGLTIFAQGEGVQSLLLSAVIMFFALFSLPVLIKLLTFGFIDVPHSSGASHAGAAAGVVAGVSGAASGGTATAATAAARGVKVVSSGARNAIPEQKDTR